MEMYRESVEQAVAANDAKPISITGELVEMRKMQLESHLMILDIIRKLYGEELRPEEAPEYNNIAGMTAANRLIADWNMRMLKTLCERLAP